MLVTFIQKLDFFKVLIRVDISKNKSQTKKLF